METSELKSRDQKVLILGSGYVSAPVVDYLTEDRNVHVTVASVMREEIDQLVSSYPNTTAVLVDVLRDQDDIEKLIQQHDIVVSLLPYYMHPDVAKLCIKHHTHMVTSSYRTDSMMALHEDAVKAGITVMNEVGVDPGIDHFLAMECFDKIKQNGGKVKSFVSYCGGLPASESVANPLRYKFSWSPRCVFLNVLKSAKWLQNKQIQTIDEGGALLDHISEIDLPGLNLEGIANRDSTVYINLYGLQGIATMLRGTLRYKGFSEAVKGLIQLGLLDASDHNALHPQAADITWKNLICELMGQKQDICYDTLKEMVYDRVGCNDYRMKAVEELGLLEEVLIDKKGSPLDTLSYYLSKRLCFESHERDVVIMRHDIGVQWSDGTEEEHHVDFLEYGEPGRYSAMATTVGFTTAIATKMVLKGEIQDKGMILPLKREVYEPILKRLAERGIKASKSVTKL